MTCILSVMWAVTCSHPCFLKTIYFTAKKKVTLSILTTHFTTHTMYITLKEGEHWLRASLACANGATILGKSEICTWHGHPKLA